LVDNAFTNTNKNSIKLLFSKKRVNLEI
jgi:hypothetical protein